jgi:hypothetical protein
MEETRVLFNRIFKIVLSRKSAPVIYTELFVQESALKKFEFTLVKNLTKILLVVNLFKPQVSRTREKESQVQIIGKFIQNSVLLRFSAVDRFSRGTRSTVAVKFCLLF